MDDDMMYQAGSYTPPQQRHWFVAWFLHVFTKRKVIYVGLALLSLGIMWWGDNYFVPLFFLIVFVTIRLVYKWLSRKEYTWILEGRMQGEIIKHCGYYNMPIEVQSSSLRLYRVPKHRLQDRNTHFYGDPNQPVATSNIISCDFFEDLPNGHMIVVYPQDRNFGNVALYTRSNPDAQKAMKKLHNKRKMNMHSREVIVKMFEEGSLGTGQQALERLNAFLLVNDEIEQALGTSDVALRKIWLFYKESIPRLVERDVMNTQLLMQKAIAMAAKFIHQSTGHPMTQAQHDRLQSIIEADPEDFDTAVRKLVVKGTKAVQTGDALAVQGNALNGGLTALEARN